MLAMGAWHLRHVSRKHISRQKLLYPLPPSQQAGCYPAKTSCCCCCCCCCFWCWFCIRERGGEVAQYKTKRKAKSRLAEKNSQTLCSTQVLSWHDQVSASKLIKETKCYQPEADAPLWQTQACLPQHCGHAELSFLTLMVCIQAMPKARDQSAL
jgi:hypothetical protein